jgi:hypothetical protein
VADREAKAVWVLLHELGNQCALAHPRGPTDQHWCADARQVNLHEADQGGNDSSGEVSALRKQLEHMQQGHSCTLHKLQD